MEQKSIHLHLDLFPVFCQAQIMSRKETKFLQSILKEYRRSLDDFTILIIIQPESEQNKTVMSQVWESQVEQP